MMKLSLTGMPINDVVGGANQLAQKHGVQVLGPFFV
jgi:hypothetical protein